MRVLEIFSGTGSVGKVCEELGYDVVSVDIESGDYTPTHITDIMKWDYTIYPTGHFNIIWASPPCTTFSNLRKCHIGRKIKAHGDTIITNEILLDDIQKIGLPILRKTEEIIEYFKPSLYFIENPATGTMKDYIDKPVYTVDYCKYAEWGYQKRTNVWTNKKGLKLLTCNKDCKNIIDINGKLSHKISLGSKEIVKDGDKNIIVNTAELREKYKDYKREYISKTIRLKDRYRVPPKLIKELLTVN
jgi:hypothetical protein